MRPETKSRWAVCDGVVAVSPARSRSFGDQIAGILAQDGVAVCMAGRDRTARACSPPQRNPRSWDYDTGAIMKDLLVVLYLGLLGRLGGPPR
ncbi:MAG: hypothetical protein ACOX4B_03700 [Bacillota bacterium]